MGGTPYSHLYLGRADSDTDGQRMEHIQCELRQTMEPTTLGDHADDDGEPTDKYETAWKLEEQIIRAGPRKQKQPEVNEKKDDRVHILNAEGVMIDGPPGKRMKK